MAKKGSGSGVHIHIKGYLRITRRGPWRNWLVHRKVMLEMCQEMCYYPMEEGKLPEGFTVEHLDHNRRHNCPENLMLLDKRIHDWISSEHGRMMQEIYASRIPYMDKADGGEPDWVTDGGEGMEDARMEDGENGQEEA